MYLSPLVLAHWINTVILCADNFTKSKLQLLIEALYTNLCLKSGIQTRKKKHGCNLL